MLSKFAELIINGDPIIKEFSSKELQNYREGIATKLINIGGRGNWVDNLCRICRRDVEPPQIAAKQQDTEKIDWVKCKYCDPVKWFHKGCLLESIPNLSANTITCVQFRK